MSYIFLPIIFCPVFGFEYPEPVTYVQYAPVHVYGPRKQDYIFITEDYHPYTHGYYPEDGSEFWDEDQES